MDKNLSKYFHIISFEYLKIMMAPFVFIGVLWGFCSTSFKYGKEAAESIVENMILGGGLEKLKKEVLGNKEG